MTRSVGQPRTWTSRLPRGGLATLLLISAAVLITFFGAWQLAEVTLVAQRVSMRTLHLLHLIRGISASLLLTAIVAAYLLRSAGRPFASLGVAGIAMVDRLQRAHEHLRWLIQMRWIAAGVTLGLIIIAGPLTSMLPAPKLPLLLTWWGLLVAANIAFTSYAKTEAQYDRQMLIQIVTDLVILTGLLNASGGVENPLSIAYLFHVILGGMFLSKRDAWVVAIIAASSFAFLAVGELVGWLPHATILLFPHSFGSNLEHAARDPLFVAGRLLSMIVAMFLTGHFTTLATERLRESEAALEKSAAMAMLDRQRLEGVIEAAGFGMMIISRDLRLEWCNERLSGWMQPCATRVGDLCQHIHHPPHPCFACMTESTLGSGETTEIEFSVPAEHGAVRYFRQSASPVRDRDGHIVQAVHVVEEVTARKALEGEAMHSSRLAILGQLAAGVAHEIGNPLSSLHARLQLIKRHTDPEFTRESLDILQTNIDRIGRIVRGVSDLARSRYDGWITLDLNAVIRDALSLVRLDRRAQNVEFAEHFADHLPAVRGIRDQLLQVFINLLLNAVEAMPNGGQLEASTAAEDGRVKVTIADSGIGMDEAVRARLFEPFFTTKTGGTGLGLSISYSLVHGHGGGIDVRSEPGAGSRFTVDLPAAEQRRASQREALWQ